MTTQQRIGLVHTGAVIIPMARAILDRELPDAIAINYLDDRIVADLGDETVADSVPGRVTALVRAAADAGAVAVLLTCSSISELASPAAEQSGIPVLRIDEAMADQAVAAGDRITVVATLPTTCGPTARLIDERARLAGRSPEVRSVVVDGAFAAVVAGDRARHDRLVAAAIEQAARGCDVVVLAQASMASAADAAEVEVPVLTSLESGVRRMRELVGDLV